MATWPTITDDDGTGTTGTVLDQALFNLIRDYTGVAWTSVAFSAGNFTASGSMSWTVASGDQNTYAYVEHGKTMHLAFDIRTSTVGGTPNTALQIAIPNGRTSSKQMGGVFQYSDNGTRGVGQWGVGAGGSVIALSIASAGNWAASTDNTSVIGTITFEIS